MDFPNEVAKLCIQKYNMLKKTGKPIDNEWTVLSGIVLKNTDNSLYLIALATGTKCLGGIELMNTKPHEKGYRLSDSHAEVLARRGFLRYIYDQIDILIEGRNSDIFTLDDEKRIKIKDGVSFHFFSSQTPCGDCSIFPKDIECNDDDAAPPIKFRKTISTGANQIVKDIYRTGAKCLSNEEKQDLKLPGINYHVTGPLRTKPGRGDPTLSLSCSDKMARWNFLGIQGSLLSLLIPQIKLETIVIGGDSPFSLEAMKRGLYKRFDNKIHRPKVIQTNIAFAQRKSTKRSQPCPSSVIWCAVRKNGMEVAVEGRKQGATKKHKNNSLKISRRELFVTFLKTLDKYQCFNNLPMHPKKITYYHCKQWSKEYQDTWNQLRLNYFRAWPNKSLQLQRFIL